MKLPDDVQHLLLRRYQNQHREWLSAGESEPSWPMEIALGAPTEQVALRQIEGVRAWVRAWQSWQGDEKKAGTLLWCERRWKSLGVQRLPEKLVLQSPQEVTLWVGESARWERARQRYQTLSAHWSALTQHLPRHFNVLADYDEIDFQRLAQTLEWITAHPHSGLYPRQLPIAGLDSKWLEGRKGLLADLVAAIQEDGVSDLNFYQRCGLKAPPVLVRMRVLDSALRTRIGGIGDITAPVKDLAALDFPVSCVFIVENPQTVLAVPDLPGAVVIMGRGYAVDVLGRLPWLAGAKCVYWGDLDTHGFAILHRARSYLPGLQSMLMDQDTLLNHKALWVNEKKQHPASALALLTQDEQAVYQGLKQQRWGQNVRLEQERIVWDTAWKALRQSILQEGQPSWTP
jgi:hypothetical protein